MGVGHHDDQRAVRRVREFGGRLDGMNHRDIGRRIGGKRFAPRIDPAHRERQRSEGERERAPDMACPEQIDCARAVPERLDPVVGGRQARREPFPAPLGRELSLDPAIGPKPGAERRWSGALGDRDRRQVGEVAPVENLDAPFDAAAATLSEFRPKRQRTAGGRAATLLQRRLGRFQRRPFQRSSANRAVKSA